MKENKFLKSLLSCLMAVSVISTTAAPVFAEDTEADPETAVEEAVEEQTEEAVVEAEAAEVEVEEDQSFEAVLDGITVSVEAPAGAFPAGTEMILSSVGADVYEAIGETVAGKVVAAVDITFVKDGEEIQPALPIKVAMNSAEIAAVENPVVVHVDDKAAELETEIVGQIEDASKDVVFEADSFSVYAVIDDGEGDEARVAVEFYGKNNAKVATMYVKNGDELLNGGTRDDSKSYIEDIVYDPGIGSTPLADRELFHGWTTDENYTTTTKAMTIDDIHKYLAEEVVGHIKEGDDPIKFYAMIFKYFNVTYFGDFNGEPYRKVSLGATTVLLRPDETIADYTVMMAYPADSNQNFKGWQTKQGEGGENITGWSAGKIYENGAEIKISGDIIFDVVAPHGNWLVYNANGKGGTFNSPAFYLPTEVTKIAENAKPENMKRYGYSFAGWYEAQGYDSSGNPLTDEDGNVLLQDTEFQFGSTLSQNTNIYAKWTTNDTANYTVIFWIQNLERTTYDLAGSYVGEGTVGQAIPLSIEPNGDEAYVKNVGSNGHYTGFTLKYEGNKPFNEKGVAVDIPKITAEGDAVLNLYFDRIEYELRFYVYWDSGSGNSRYSYAHYPQSPGSTTVVRQNVNQFYNNSNHPTTNNDVIDGEQPNIDYTLKTAAAVTEGTPYYFSFTAYYGEDISKKWPEYRRLNNVASGGSTHYPVSFIMMNGAKNKEGATGTSGQGTVKGVITKMDEKILGATNDADGNFLICRYDTSFNNWRYHIFFEQIDGVDYSGKTTATYNNKKYYEDHIVVSRSSNQNVNEQNPPQFDGYDQTGNSNEQGQTGGNNGNNARWTTGTGNNQIFHTRYYYDRQKFNINYMDGIYVDGRGNTLQTKADKLLENNNEQIAHGSTIPDNYKNYIPTLPQGESGYVFEGWFADEGCLTPYTFTTMPVNGITVHAKWRQVQYRVFLHPNAEIEETDPNTNETVKSPDLTLSWGDESASDKQQMCFRVDYGDKISLPNGTRKGYEFKGWFLADGSLYMGKTELNDTTVPATPAYTKTEKTDTIDKFGQVIAKGEKYWISNQQLTAEVDPYNADVNRTWITRKLELYGKWSKVIEGNDGIDIIYDIGEYGKTGSGPKDELKYKDNVGAIAGEACEVDESYSEDYQFLYWVVQKWVGDPETGHYEDTDITVAPGDEFTTNLDYSRQDVKESHQDPNDPEVTIIDKADYTMQLRAEYGPKKQPTPTHITWYANNGTDAKVEDKDIPINKGVTIRPKDTFIYELHTFLGWARVENEGTAFDPSTLTEDDCYLKWFENEGCFKVNIAKSGEAVWKKASEVAADEAHPYHDLYAVWSSNDFVIDYSHSRNQIKYNGDGKQIAHRTYDPALAPDEGWIKDTTSTTSILDKKVQDGNVTFTLNITARVEPGYIYGGYYSENTNTGAYVAKDQLTYWNSAKAETKIGLAIKPEKDKTYYLKEVPVEYLQPFTQYVYNKTYSNVVTKLNFMTAVDDNNYDEVGRLYLVQEGNNVKAYQDYKDHKVYKKYTIKKANGDSIITDVKRVIGKTEAGDYGYLAVWDTNKLANVFGDYNSKIRAVAAGSVFTEQPYWKTPDGVYVVTNYRIITTTTDNNKNGFLTHLGIYNQRPQGTVAKTHEYLDDLSKAEFNPAGDSSGE